MSEAKKSTGFTAEEKATMKERVKQLKATAKFKYRYATLGFNDAAQLDNDDIWPTAFALTAWSPVVERQVIALVKKALS